jgi:hypothetical protein
MSDCQSNIRFLCPVKSCSRAFKSKTTWTNHLRSTHPLVNVQAHNPETVLSYIPDFPTRNHHNIQVSPPMSPADGRGSRNDFEMGEFASPPAEATEGFVGMISWPLFSFNIDNSLPPDFEGSSSSLPPHSDFLVSEADIEYHPHINGKLSLQ